MVSHGHTLLSLEHWEGGNESLPKDTENTSLYQLPFWQWERDGFAQVCGLCFGKQQLACSLPLPQRHNSLLQLESRKSFLSLLPPLKNLIHRVLWGKDCWFSTASPEPWAAVTQLSTIYWNNRLFILNLTSNMVMVSFYIYTELFIPEDPKMFQLLMGSSCLIADGMTAQQCRAGAGKSSTSSRNCRGNSGRWNWITQTAI